MAAQAVANTLAGCVGCQTGVELIQKQVPNSLNLVTFCSFAFIALEGLVFQSKFFSVAQRIPTRSYLQIVAINFVVQVCNNYAIHFNIYFPLFIIFKSASLLSHLVLRYFLKGRIYTPQQIGSILTVTSGIVIFTLASYEPPTTDSIRSVPQWATYVPIPPFFIGILLLSVAVVLSSYMGICQEELMARYGKHHKEAMFYVHFMSLPAFAILGSNLSDAISATNNSPSFEMAGFDTHLPSVWIYILGYCMLQWICVDNIYRLTSLMSSLNVNMVLTLRKFVSLVVSFWIFGNPFNMFHMIGSFIVFVGTIMYSLVF